MARCQKYAQWLITWRSITLINVLLFGFKRTEPWNVYEIKFEDESIFHRRTIFNQIFGEGREIFPPFVWSSFIQNLFKIRLSSQSTLRTVTQLNQIHPSLVCTEVVGVAFFNVYVKCQQFHDVFFYIAPCHSYCHRRSIRSWQIGLETTSPL